MKEQVHSASVGELSYFNRTLRLPDGELGQLVQLAKRFVDCGVGCVDIKVRLESIGKYFEEGL